MRALLMLLLVIVPGLSAQEDWTPKAATAAVEAVLRAIDEGQSPGDASKRLDALLDDTIAYAPLDEHETFTVIVSARRLVEQMDELPQRLRAQAWPVLREHSELATSIPMLVDARHDDLNGVYQVLIDLHEADADSIARHAPLVAAICVVHDDEFRSGAMSTRTSAPDPVRVYEHLTSNRLQFDPDDLPPELLVHLVDSIASQGELDWALDRHANDRLVGKRYHDVTYDTRYYKQGADKRINSYDYTLANIRQHGGVCTDQAYYAATIGKAIGVPTAIVSGRAGEVGHCWVGFVRRQGGRLAFDFDEGRYDDFEDVRGIATDPQTGRRISDDVIALRAELASTDDGARLGAIALLDADERVRRGYEPPDDDARPQDAATRLALLERAASLSPAEARIWRRASGLASSMTPKQLRAWADALHANFGQAYPTFTFEVLAPMISSVEDPREQSRLWDWAYSRYRRQHDLACEILIEHAGMWERQGDRARAYDAYVDAAHRYLNDTAVALDALTAAERMLAQAEEDDHILALYEEAWRRVRQPSRVSPNFIRGTNWFKVGMLYVERLVEAGRTDEAARVTQRLAG